MKMLRKIIDGKNKNLEISQENVYEGVSFATTLLLKYLITDTFWNMYRKVAVLKNNTLRKKSMVDQLLNKVATL